MTESVTTSGPLAPGQFFGAYRINRLLGRGGMGAVYEAESVEDGRVVALKLLAVGLDDADARRRFLREGHLAAALNHPNTVYIYGTDEIEGTPTIAMELVAGGTLEEKLRRDGPLPVKETIEIALQIIDGLSAAQAHGILHRDIKPSNCFMTLDGSVKVGDFGLSKSIAGNKESQVTRTGMFIGTPAFSAPEQLLGEPLDVRSDIYSVGATLYNLLTGKLPFEAITAVQMVAAVLQGTPVSPRTHRPAVPAGLAAVVLRCLQRRPEDRYAGYDHMRKELESLRGLSAEAASIRARIGAFLLDYVGMTSVTLALFMVPGVWGSVDKGTMSSRLIGTALGLLGLLLVKAVPEGIWGTSPGGALVGLKVKRVDGGKVRMASSIARGAILWTPWMFGESAKAVFKASDLNPLPLAVQVACVLGLMCTMRRANGFAAVHDLLTGVRVVRGRVTGSARAARAARAARRATAPAPAVAVSGNRVGPFIVVKSIWEADNGSALLQGHDPALRRAVWIHRREPGCGPLDQERRDLAREGRLRWVASRRNPAENWDAYEAPGGISLGMLSEDAASWGSARDWLVDLTEEICAAKRSGEPLWLGLDRVWIGDGGRVVVLDFPYQLGNDHPSAFGAGAFVQQVARRAMSSPESGPSGAWQVLPVSARNFLDDLPNVADPQEISRALKTVTAAPARLTRVRRVVATALTLMPSVIVGCLLWAVLSATRSSDPQLLTLQPLLEYITPDSSVSADSVVLANRQVIEVYLATRYQDVLRDPARRQTLIGRGFASRWSKIDSILQRHDADTAAEKERSVEIVERAWKGVPPGSSRMIDDLEGTQALAFVMTLALTGVAAALAALLFRLGLAARLAGIDIVTNAGLRAGRLRLLLRALLTWLPLWAGLLLLLVAGVQAEATTADRGPLYALGHLLSRGVRGMLTMTREGSPVGVALIATAALLLIVGAVSLCVSLRTPQRGLADRLVGTHLVPR